VKKPGKNMKFAITAGLTGLLISPLAQSGTVNLWGQAHLSGDFVDNGSTDSQYVASNSSRLGISGEQDIEHGMKVLFNYETGVDFTGQGNNDGNGGANSTGQLFTATRESWIGLSTGFGSFKAGKVGGVNEWMYDYNLFADQVGDLGNIWGASGLAGRFSNAVQYSSPVVSGFDVRLGFSPNEGVSDTSITVLKANYAMADMKFGLGYMNQGMGAGADEHVAMALTASYNMKKFSVGGGYQTETDAAGVAGNDRSSFTLGGSFNLGMGSIKGQFTQSTGDVDKSDATQIAIGYDHSLGKNTTIYVAYAMTDNDDNAAFNANNWGHGDSVASAAGDDPSAFSVGLVYKFDAALMK